MGLNRNSLLFLLAAHRQGVRFDRCLTLGRLQMNLYRKPLRALLERAGVFDEELFAQLPADGSPAYADPVLRMLGARDLQVMDVSDYEGATLVQNLNEPVPEPLRSQFDVIIDGGTLEHVFNVPVAFRNCMEMVKPGGSVFFHSPANNWCGHGFYQFSPDLFFRVFCPENGFEVRRMIMHADGPYNRWYEVVDPRVARSRVELITLRLMCLLVHVRKTGAPTGPWQWPQQTTYEAADYAAARAAKPDEAVGAARRTRWAERFPGLSQVLRVAKTGILFYSSHSLWNRRFYRPVSKGPS